jgi:predicted  nucleic acid-binding Zn-ribbon protein
LLAEGSTNNVNILAISKNNLYNFVMSQISNLFRLQQIDSQIDTAKSKLLSIDKTLQDNTSLIDARRNVLEAEENQKLLSKKLHDAENRSYDTRIKTELAEKSLYGGKIQNPKELQELQIEIASLKKLMVNLEDKQLEAMMELEEAETRLMWANEEYHEKEKSQIEQNAELTGEKSKIISHIEKLEAERKAVIPTISSPELGTYEQLRKSRSGVAVVRISSKACSACGTTLTAALIQATQTSGQLTRCPTCGRILYAG